MLQCLSRSLRRRVPHDLAACAARLAPCDASLDGCQPSGQAAFATAAAPEPDASAKADGSPAADSVALHKRLLGQKLQHKAALSKLRKEWAAEQAVVTERRRKAEEARAAAAAEAKAARSRRRQEKQQAEAKEEQLHLQEEAQQREVMRAESAERRRARELVYDMYREDKVQWLAEQSRNWIAPDQLDERIDWALSNPQPLGSTAKTLFAEQQRQQHEQEQARQAREAERQQRQSQ